MRHNAVNVTFQVEKGQDITFAIDARDWADDITGLEHDNRCVGDRGLRAMFSNGVVTNRQWVCSTYHYGPVNWKQCFGATNVRNFSYQLLPECKAPSTPILQGCVAHVTERPNGWAMPGFVDSHWEYALEWDEDVVGFGLPPTGCTDPNTYISSDIDHNGDNVTCPQNLDWGDAVFIWRNDLDLDNRILCRYTLRVEDSGTVQVTGSIIIALFAMVVASFSVMY